ncbi:uncharacterized protein LOC130504516 [Raphanus sativus]|uniref:Uncharacterized protein LOC130504516 n=1 Tax=Raphanus sativus TaxID=3726 RepID=A0A9W3CU41_RAPSA|nr:uncharacterized protein LOC130504516 [Raphanus sativus]
MDTTTSETKENPYMCFKNCEEECQIHDHACQLKCEALCLSPPPSLLVETKENPYMCFKNCEEECQIHDHACQLKCEALCLSPPPSLSADEAVMAPEEGKSDMCYRDCSNKWGLDSARMERCLKTCPTSATLF